MSQEPLVTIPLFDYNQLIAKKSLFEIVCDIWPNNAKDIPELTKLVQDVIDKESVNISNRVGINVTFKLIAEIKK